MSGDTKFQPKSDLFLVTSVAPTSDVLLPRRIHLSLSLIDRVEIFHDAWCTRLDKHVQS
jgi:hypothetical protein